MKKQLRWSIATAAVILLCIFSYLYADIPAALWFHTLQHTIFYDLFKRITLFGDSLWYLVPGLLLFLVFRKKNPFRAFAGLFLFSAVAVSGISADIIKYFTGRARPKLYFSDQLYGFYFFHHEAAWISFPSGHSATAFSAALVFATLYPRWRLLFLLAAFLIAFSRIFLTKHYLSDAIAGSFLGVISTVLLYNLYFKSKFNALKTVEN